MFRIFDDRKEFYQWDLNQKLVVDDDTVNEVHFCNKTDDCSLVCEVYNEDGKRLVNVPNVLLQTDWKIRVYAYCGNYTKVEECFKVNSRSKPADYIYTETEVKRYEDFEERLTNLQGYAENLDDITVKTDWIDTTLKVEGYVAEAKAVGTAVNSIHNRINNTHNILSEGITNAEANANSYTDAEIAKAMAEPQYELIYSTEVSETGIRALAASNFSLDKICIYMYLPQGSTTASGGLEVYSGSVLVGYAWLASLVVNTAPRIAMAIGKNENGLSFFGNTAAINYASTGQATPFSVRNLKTDAAPFTRISLYLGSGAEFPVGTKIDIWGVKAQ